MAATGKILARGLAAPGYMGLDKAYHVYLADIDHRFCWPCFGRGDDTRDPGVDLGTFTVYIDWAKALVAPDSGDQYLAGVSNTKNGTCHSIANRILALSLDPHSNVSASADDGYAVAIFGKYGFGIKQFCELLAQSAQKASIPADILDKVVKRVQLPFEDELGAWCDVIKDRLQIDMLAVFKANPDLKSRALQVVTDWCKTRDAIYERHFDYKQGRPPSDNEIAKVRAELLVQAASTAKNILDTLEKAHMITPEQKKQFVDKFQEIIKTLGMGNPGA